MKIILLLCFATLLAAGSALAQGTVNFVNTSTGTIRAPVYGPDPLDPQLAKTGNTSTGNPAGTQTYGGNLLSGTGYTCQLWGHVGINQPEESLQLLATTPFRTGVGAGFINSMLAQVPNAPIDGFDYYGTFQLRAWDNMGGTVTSWAQVQANPLVARGASALTSEGPLGGTGNPVHVAPILLGLRSFNLSVPSTLPSLSVRDILVTEGSNGTVNAVFPVILSPPSDQTVTVNFATTDGTALAGSDYNATSGTLTFQPGETNKSVSVVLTADADPEPDETFTLSLSNPSNALVLRGTATATITELRFESIAVDVALNFHTVTGHVYALERSDLSMNTEWTPVAGATNIVGTGGTVTAYDHGAGCVGGQIYRTRIIQ